MEREPRERGRAARVGDAEREAAVAVLQRAGGEGRLGLDELSHRVERALTAEDADQLHGTLADLDESPQVGAAQPVSSVVAVLGDRRQVGRWRLGRRLRVLGLAGDVQLDLRDVVVDQEVVDIRAVTVLGNVCIDVPEGIDVELTGFDVLGDRELRLAPVPRRTGTPLIRVRAYGILGDVDVRVPEPGEEPPSWWDWFKGSRQSRRLRRARRELSQRGETTRPGGGT